MKKIQMVLCIMSYKRNDIFPMDMMNIPRLLDMFDHYPDNETDPWILKNVH